MRRSRHTIRLQRLDYSLPNQFFVTVCTEKHGCYFDKYPKLYTITTNNIYQIQRKYRNISIPIYIIMPNHLHLIIIIKSQAKDITLGTIIKTFKGRIINDWLKIIKLRKINTLGCIWQRNYYEHRIRNAIEYEKYTQYIKQNPAKWNTDRYNPKNLFLKCRGLACQDP